MKTTKEQIADSLISLLKDNPYIKISIKMICDKAPVSRNTFYYHFDGKDKLLQWICERDFMKYAFPYFKIKTDNISTKSLFLYILEHREFYTSIYEVDDGQLLAECLSHAYSLSLIEENVKEYATPRPSQSHKMNPEICNLYANAGTAAVLRFWIGNGMAIPVEKIAYDLMIMLTKSLENVRDYNLF